MFARFHLGLKHEEEESSRQRSLTLMDTPLLHLALRTPGSLEDVVPYGKLLLEGKGLLVCLNDLEEQDRPRAQDYLAGVAYVIGATETEISSEVTMYLPGNVDTINA